MGDEINAMDIAEGSQEESNEARAELQNLVSWTLGEI